MADVLLTPGSRPGLPRYTPKGIHHAGRDTVLERTTRGGPKGALAGHGREVGDCGYSQDPVTRPMLTRLYCHKDVYE